MQIAENKNDQLAKVSKNLMLSQPFYGFFLITLNKIWTDKVPTAGVSKNGINFQLLINPEFWQSLSPTHRMGLLTHELLHIGFFHIHEPLNSKYNKLLANISMDIQINQFIHPDNLPEGGYLPSSFPDLDLPLKAGWHTYYELLMQEKDNNSDSGEMIRRIIDADSQGKPETENGEMIPDHSTWEEFENLSDAEKKLIKSQTEHILKEIAEQVEKSQGNIPGQFKSILDRIRNPEPPKFDWRGYLRRFTGGSDKVYTKKLRRKFNKRFEENPGLKIKPRRHLLVAIDTSGSVSQNELVEFFNEITHIHKTGSDITVIQCDTTINSIEPFKPNVEIQIVGRGGTDFDPVLEYYNENQKKYTCLVYLTDGECYTDVNVKGKMLWVISTQGQINKSLKGPQIKLN